MMSIAKTMLLLCIALTTFADPLTFDLSEVTAREWKIGEKKIMRLSKFETIETPKLNLAIAHYGLKPEETTCLDFYDYRPVANSTNAHLILLGHDIEAGKLVKVTVVMKTNDVPPIVNIVRENTNNAGRITHNMYGYRLTPEGLTRTTENFIWEPKQTATVAKKKWFFFK
jgi:hypothetical protein